MNRNNIIIGCLGALLTGSVAAGFYMHQMHYGDNERIKELESQLHTLRKQEEQSAVDRRVSQQMEKIAYGQQALSEERSREAIRLSEIAQEMTLRSEKERKNALEAQAAAEISAQEAQTSYLVAEQQRLAAEHAKLVTDTLNYISLGRTLGSQSYGIYRAGDKEIGTMLAYASYLYTNDYGGNLYSSSVFPALTQAADSRRNWSLHNGRITSMDISKKDGSLLTVSTYGELLAHRIQGDKLKTTRLIDDRNYWFRGVYAATMGKSYAICHTGQLVIVDGDQTRVIYLEGITRPFSLQPINDGRQLLVIGENSIALLDITTDKVIGTRHLDFGISCTGNLNNKPLLFDNRGRMHLVTSLDNITNEKIPVSGQVTAFACSKTGHQNAYGMADGTIWLINKKGKTNKFVGHLSKVTKMRFHGKQLYSSSYDGRLLFWMTSDTQIKPITLFQAGSWLTDFTFSNDKDYIWTGEYNGNISEYLISLPKISQHIRQNVKRNFTQEEWNYYVGKGIPYREVRNEK